MQIESYEELCTFAQLIVLDVVSSDLIIRDHCPETCLATTKKQLNVNAADFKDRNYFNSGEGLSM